jgi:hypothetical protein
MKPHKAFKLLYDRQTTLRPCDVCHAMGTRTWLQTEPYHMNHAVCSLKCAMENLRHEIKICISEREGPFFQQPYKKLMYMETYATLAKKIRALMGWLDTLEG